MRSVNHGWVIAFDAVAGVFAFACWTAADIYQAGWGPSVAAFAADQSYRRSMLVELLAYAGGGAFVGALTVAVCFMEGP
jgi:hypothetical protein